MFGYFILLLVVGFLFSRKMKSLEDFFLASRNLPALLVFLSIAASWIGATSTLVSVDEAFQNGISSFWVIGIPAVLTVLCFVFFLARPIRKLNIVTLPDLVELRYGAGVRHLASILIVWYMVLLAASQMVAVGNFLKTILGTSYLEGLVLGTAVVLIYAALGGFFSVVVTDGLQFFLLILGLSSLFVFLSGEVSFQEISTVASNMGRGSYFNFFADIKTNTLIALSFTCAWIISPIVWQRIQASRSEASARQGLLAAGGTFMVVYSVIVCIGMLGLALYPSGIQSGPLLSAIISKPGAEAGTGIGPILGVILFIAITAAVMSTMDTALNTGALTLVRDVYQRLFRIPNPDRVILISRLATFIITALAFLIATRLQSILKTLGLASEIMTEGLFIPGVIMLFLKRKLPTAGLLSLVLGGLYALAGFLIEMGILHLNWPIWPYSVPYGLSLGLIGFLLGAAIDILRSRHYL